MPPWPRRPFEPAAEGWLIGDFSWRWVEEDQARPVAPTLQPTVLLTEPLPTRRPQRTPSVVGAGEYVSRLVHRARRRRHRGKEYLLLDGAGTTSSQWGSGHFLDWQGLAAALEGLLRRA